MNLHIFQKFKFCNCYVDIVYDGDGDVKIPYSMNVALCKLEHLLWCQYLISSRTLKTCPSSEPLYRSPDAVTNVLAMSCVEEVPRARQLKIFLMRCNVGEIVPKN